MVAPGERKKDRCSIHRLWQWTGKFAGLRLRVGLARGETQEEHVWNLILRRSDVDDNGASVSQLQREVLNLRAQVTSQSRLADAVRTVNNLATAQVRTETPTLIDVKGLGRPKEFIGREEDFQQWSKKWRRSLLL